MTEEAATDSQGFKAGATAAGEPSRPTPVYRPVAWPRRRLVAVGLVVGLVAMVIALFLPWSIAAGSDEGLAQYGAPQPAIAAWVMLALGLAGAIVATVSYIFGNGRALVGAAVGALIYLLGTGAWYVASVLPSVVATGCNSSGGPLCNSPAASPTIPASGIASGLVVAVVASTGVLLGTVIADRLTRSQDGRQSFQ